MLCGKNWIVDGGLGSSLQAAGYPIEKDPLWSARMLQDNPQAIKEVHMSFLEAGANVLITNSYQASIPSFAKHLSITENETLTLITQSVIIAKETIEEFRNKNPSEKDTQFLVAGSVGPYGACQADGSEYNGSYIQNISKEELQEWHRPRIAALVGAGVDLLAVETIPAAAEALAVLELLKEFPDTKVWCTFSCKNGHATNFGDDFKVAVKLCYELSGAQLVGIGINCTAPHFITSLLTGANNTLPSPNELPRVVYPNSGESWKSGQGWEGRPTNLEWIKNLKEWTDLGATVIGGCCRVTTHDIKDIANHMSN
ncbi:unnamed protein product [Meganyctiphanes norvegica]|uniref:Hcy-binding domain-containing protein n=1 Tax=Meganyctiphanes norvegica TaxID=48144 RepID=A0AAV2Q9B8_MEGNR